MGAALPARPGGLGMSRILAGRSKGRRLLSPEGLKTRPTGSRVKKSLFDILAPELPGARFLDLCAGGGGVGLEALSRGASRVVFVESSPAACAVIRENLKTLGAAGGEVHCQEARVALKGLATAGASFEIAYLDPPYESPLYEPLIELLGGLLADGGVAAVEHFKKRPLAETIGPLRRVRSVKVGDHVLSFFRRGALQGGD
jgi:16S rRNA (guanine966-N2)-methyltransferase